MTYLAAAAGALGTVLLLLSRSRSTLLGGFVLVGIAEAALLASQGAGASLIGLVTRPIGLGALALGLGVLAGVAAVLVRHPIAVAPLALVAAPLRPPLAFDGGGFAVESASGQLG